jgi:hypothetical protein
LFAITVTIFSFINHSKTSPQMKKLYTSFAALMLTGAAFGQTLDNAGMETWRTGSTGTSPIVSIQAPTQWYGFDSMVVALGQSFGAIIGAGSDWHPQLFQENTLKKSGSSSAKIMTVKQDTLGYFSGLLSNAAVNVDVAALTLGGDPMSAVSFEGGTPVTLRITSVSAWVAYFAGKDEVTGMMGGADEGLLTVQAIALIGGVDSVIGTGSANISPSSAFTQITADVTYTTTGYDINKVRILFASSGGSGSQLDSSTLYVDDVTMVGIPQSVAYTNAANDLVKIYPVPAGNAIYFNGPASQPLQCVISSVSSQSVATLPITGNASLDVSSLPVGLYLYTITHTDGTIAQRGKISIAH